MARLSARERRLCGEIEIDSAKLKFRRSWSALLPEYSLYPDFGPRDTLDTVGFECACGRTGMVGSVVRIAVLALALFGALAARADFEAGQRAWDAGRPDEALAQWQAVAGSGDRRAMLALGRMYRRGLGVLQDYVESHKWLNLAASRGEAEAVEERDALAAKMTPQQVAAAQERAAAWRPSGTATPGADRTRREAVPAPAVSAGAPRADEAPETTPAVGPPPARALREAQRLLAALGYEPGAADGKWGERTGRAYPGRLRMSGK